MKSEEVSDFEIIEFDDQYEPHEITNKKPEDLATSLVNTFSELNLKLFFILFLIFLFISSDVFIDKFLDRFSGSVEAKVATSKGTVIQGVCLVILFIIADILIQNNII